MDRIQKYKESLCKFIKDKSGLMENDINNNYLNQYIYDIIKESDMIYPILLLTIMNSQNKKNHISMQGYHIASCISFVGILFQIIENKSEIIKNMGIDDYNKIIRILLININRTTYQNMKSIKNTYKDNEQKLINIMINSMEEINNTVKTVNDFEDFRFITTNNKCHYDIINWYLKDDTTQIDIFNNLKQVSTDSINDYINKKITIICELAILLGWIIGGGNIKTANKFKKVSKYFAIMYKLSIDFSNVTNDLLNSTTFSSNYVLNFGLQASYELFLTNKEKFIEELITEDVYTGTIKEMVNLIESNIDTLIDQTSPDLKSNYSSRTN